jgi:hypothetical protein
MFKTVAQHIPPPPEATPPVMWGVEDHVRRLFAPHGVELEFARASVLFEDESPEAFFEDSTRKLGPLVLARAALEPQGKWPALRHDLLDLYNRLNTSTDGSYRAEGEYLVTIARVPA